MASSMFKVGQIVRLKYERERYGRDTRVRLLGVKEQHWYEEVGWRWECVSVNGSSVDGFVGHRAWDIESSLEKCNGLLDV